jgi:hypothetical protein
MSQSDQTNESLLWDIRFFIYQRFAATTQPPTVEETAAEFHLDPRAAARAYQDLHNRDAIFFEPGALRIRMAFPFSAIPTPFRVRAGGSSYFANCAWDAFGIPAALHADAAIETSCAEDGQPLTLAVQAGKAIQHGERVHFLLPFQKWYADLSFT